METSISEQSEFKKFDVFVENLFSVSHEGLQRREAKWTKKRWDKKAKGKTLSSDL